MKTTAAVCLLAALAMPLAADAQEFPFAVEDAVQAGAAALDALRGDEADFDAVDAPRSLAEWREFWREIDRALQTQSIDELAGMLPEVELAMANLERVPGSEPYVDWLRQRLDYFSMAKEATAAVSRPLPDRPLLEGSARPALRVSATVRDPAAWKRRLGERSPPDGADEWIPVLKEIFRDEGVPHQLVWLAEVESSFDPAAVSPSGAAGLFQFMPATAVRFGLRLEPRDERHDPEKSAKAAAQYLRFLHGAFRSWPLALAAYNAGEGAVGRTLEKQQATTFEEIAPYLPAETQMYVPKVMATVSVREGVDAGALPAPTVRVASRR